MGFSRQDGPLTNYLLNSDKLRLLDFGSAWARTRKTRVKMNSKILREKSIKSM